MTFLSLMLAAWPAYIDDLHPGTRTRMLADDVLLSSEGDGDPLELEEKHTDAVQSTIFFFQHLGARLSPATCRTFADDPRVRAVAKRRIVDGIRARIPTGTDMRDLGAHMSLAALQTSSTLTKRIEA